MSTVLRSKDFSCPSCVRRIEHSLKALPGVKAARVLFATGRIEVEHDPAVAAVDTLISAVRKAGYDARAAAF